jgi:hypothetical protein
MVFRLRELGVTFQPESVLTAMAAPPDFDFEMTACGPTNCGATDDCGPTNCGATDDCGPTNCGATDDCGPTNCGATG